MSGIQAGFSRAEAAEKARGKAAPSRDAHTCSTMRSKISSMLREASAATPRPNSPCWPATTCLTWG